MSSYRICCCSVLFTQVAVRKGTARSADHAQLVHAQWLFVAMYGIELFIKRVATDDNVADLPSRQADLFDDPACRQRRLLRRNYECCAGKE